MKSLLNNIKWLLIWTFGVVNIFGNQAETNVFFSPSSISKYEAVEDNAARTALSFWKINHTDLSKSYEQPQGVVYRSPNFVAGPKTALLLKTTRFLKQFEFKISEKNDPQNSYTLVVRASPIIENWEQVSWNTPKNLLGKEVNITITNIRAIHPTSEFSFSAPFASDSHPTSEGGYHLLITLLSSVLLTILVCLPGVAFIIGLDKQFSINPLLYFPIIITTIALLSYLCFWIFKWNTTTGVIIVFSVYSYLILYVAQERKQVITVLWNNCDFRNGIALLAIGTIVSNSVGFLFDGWDTPTATAQGRFLSSLLPHDNILPLILSERIFNGQPVIPFFADWLSSDRPPLQAAIILLLRPFSHSPETQYQLLSTVLQCSLIPFVYTFLRTANQTKATSLVISLTILFSASFLLNSFYVWPKLLPVSFMLLNLSFVFFPSKLIDPQKTPIVRSLLLGTSTTLALLTHGGSIIGIIPIYALGFITGKLPKLKHWPYIILPFLLCQIPWSCYQHFIDPPGDRLLKWHIAGYHGDSTGGFVSILLEQYRLLDFPTWIYNKTQNINQIIGFQNIHFLHLFPYQFSAHFPLLRTGMFANLGVSIIFQLPFLLLLPFLLKKNKRRTCLAAPNNMILISIIGIIFWILLIFSPGRTTLHQGTYFIPILITTSLMLYGILAAPRISSALAILNILLTSIVWVMPGSSKFHDPDWIINNSTPNIYCLTLYGICVAVAIFWIIRSYDSTPKACSTPSSVDD